MVTREEAQHAAERITEIQSYNFKETRSKLDYYKGSNFHRWIETLVEYAEQEEPDVKEDGTSYYFVGPLTKDIVDTITKNGFSSPSDFSNAEDRGTIIGKLGLVLSEVKEYNDAVSDGEDDDRKNEELADAVIRVLHLAGGLGTRMDNVLNDRRDWAIDQDQRDDCYTKDALWSISNAMEFARRENRTSFELNLAGFIERTERQASSREALWAAVKKKNEANKKREYRHGTSVSL